MTMFKNKYRIETTRFQGRDYSAAGWYYVTICTKNRRRFFGRVVNGEMRLSRIGEIAHRYWMEIPVHFPGVDIDEFVVMPNHVHGIVVIRRPYDVETRHVASLHMPSSKTTNRFGPLHPGSLSTVIHAYKSAVTRWCRQNRKPDFAWQPRFYDRIIRHQAALNRIRAYIIHNPHRWDIGRH